MKGKLEEKIVGFLFSVHRLYDTPKEDAESKAKFDAHCLLGILDIPSTLNWRKPEEGLMALRNSSKPFLIAYKYNSSKNATIFYETARWFNDEEVRTDSGTLFHYNEIIAYIKIPELECEPEDDK